MISETLCAEVGVLDFRRSTQVGCTSLQLDPAVGQHIAAVGDFKRLHHVLFDQKDGQPTIAQIADQIEDPVDDLRGKAERGFV